MQFDLHLHPYKAGTLGCKLSNSPARINSICWLLVETEVAVGTTGIVYIQPMRMLSQTAITNSTPVYTAIHRALSAHSTLCACYMLGIIPGALCDPRASAAPAGAPVVPSCCCAPSVRVEPAWRVRADECGQPVVAPVAALTHTTHRR